MINNLLKATEPTIWMVSLLYAALTLNRFRCLATSIIVLSIFLSWLPSVCLGRPHALELLVLLVKKTLASLLQFLRLIPSPRLLLFFPDMFPEACSFMPQLSAPDSSIWSW